MYTASVSIIQYLSVSWILFEVYGCEERLRVLDGAHSADDLLEYAVHLDDGGGLVARMH